MKDEVRTDFILASGKPPLGRLQPLHLVTSFADRNAPFSTSPRVGNAHQPQNTPLDQWWALPYKNTLVDRYWCKI
jgi:hypothetical protein